MNYDEIYKNLKNNLINELNLFDEDKLLDKIEENKFSKNIIYHSKSLAYNYSPFYKELSGSSLDTLKSGEPKKLGNNYIYFGDNSIQKIERYGKTGKLSGTDYIIEKQNIREIISIDNFNDIEKYIKVLFEDGIPIESYTIDDIENGVATIYIYNNEKIFKSLSFAMIDGLTIKNETIYNYDKDNNLDSIFSTVGDHQGIIYKKWSHLKWWCVPVHIII